MKTSQIVILIFISPVFLVQCGKPIKPEVLNPNMCSGGYEVVKIFNAPGYSQDVIKKESLCYMTQGEGGLMIVNIEDPVNPVTVSLINDNVRGYSTKLALKDSVLYIAAGSFGVTVVNVADPYTPIVTVSNLSMKPAKSFCIMGNYLITAISEQGIKFSEISYPTQPDIRGVLNTSGYAQGVIASTDQTKLYVACGEMGFSIFDISDFQDGYGTYPLIGKCDTEGYAESIVIDENKSLAYISCGKAGLQIIDYSDTNDIHVVGQYYSGGYAKELILKGNTVYMTAEEKGLLVIDITDSEHPELIGSVDSEYALGLDIDDNYVYIADEIQGLIIVSIPE